MRWAEKVARASGRWPAPSRELVLRVLGQRSDDDITTAAADYLRKVAELTRLQEMAEGAAGAVGVAWEELVGECLKAEAGGRGLAVRPDAFAERRAHVERLAVEPASRQSER